MEFVILGTLEGDLWIALALFFFVWLYSWAKGNLGSAKLGILFALIVSYITFYTHKELIWVVVVLFLLANFGKEILSKVNPFHDSGGGGGH